MNFIKSYSQLIHKTSRFYSTFPQSTLCLQNLTKKTLIRLKGDEVSPFLQGLITNDMQHLIRGATGLYAMFLNKGGRVLFDSIIYRSNEINTYFVECDEEIANDLRKHLMMFRVRKKIPIDIVGKEYSIWVAFKSNEISGGKVIDKKLENEEPILCNDDKLLICTDPRVKNLGTRIIAPSDYNEKQIQSGIPNILLNLTDSNLYKQHRYELGIGEGISDLPTGKTFPLEANCDYLHGLSVHKGCYLGQEFTARTYHTGVVRKRLMPLLMDTKIKPELESTVETADGKNVGKLRGVMNGAGLALLRIEPVLEANVSLFIRGNSCSTSRPFWWPQEAPVTTSKEKQHK